MASSIGNPELVREDCWRVNGELLSLFIVSGGSLHLWRIVSKAKFGEAETPHVFETINILHDLKVALRVKIHECAAEQVELNGELGGEVSIDLAEHLVSCKDVLGVVFEIKNGDQLFVTNSLDSSIGEVSLLIQ